MTITQSNYLAPSPETRVAPASEHVQRAEAMLADDRAVPAVPAPSNAT